MAAPVFAQGSATGQSPESFLNGLATLDSRYLPAGSAGIGETIDLYTGSLGFVVTDVSLPGNSGLPVALTRRFEVGYPGQTGETPAFGDWQLDVPVIEGVVARENWKVGADGASTARCSDFADLPTLQRAQNLFWPDEYHAGFHLRLPGQGRQTLLKRLPSTNTHQPVMSAGGVPLNFPVVTRDDAMAACIPLAPNSEDSGEGFLVVTPDGWRWTFDYLVYTDTRSVWKPATAGSQTPATPTVPPDDEVKRSVAQLYATHVEDRYGHWVDYHYSGHQLIGIEADDGRSIELRWQDGVIHQVIAQPAAAAPRRWTYDVQAALVEGGQRKTLTSVTGPEGMATGYDLAHLAWANDPAAPNGCLLGPLSNADSALDAVAALSFTGTVTTAAGLTVSYVVEGETRGHAAIPKGCMDYQINTHPVYYRTLALQTRSASGAGVPSRTWTYDYSDPNASWDTDCTSGCPYDGTVWTTVTDPQGHPTRATFSNRFDASEGQRLATAWYASAAALNADTPLRTERRRYAAADHGPWPTLYGSDNLYRANVLRSRQQSPLESRTISEGGIDYRWTATAWNSYAQPLEITRARSGVNGPSVSETLAYENNTAQWVLGQFKRRTVTAPAAYANTVPEARSYDPVDATLTTIHRFGQLAASYTWYPVGDAAAGQLKTVRDGLNHATIYSDYAHGVPQTITYADDTGIALGVNDFGEVLSVTDELGHETTVERDALGRITHQTFPADAGHSWAPVDVSYQSVIASDYGVSGTHWKVTTTQGKRTDVTIYDAALSPVLTSARDTATGKGTLIWRQFDATGAQSFASYPLAYSANLPANRPGVSTQYDALGRVTKTRADSELGPLITTTEYQSGNEITVTDPKGHTITTAYQAFDTPATDHPLKTTFADGTVTTVTRDVWGKPLTMTQSGTYTPAGGSASTVSVTHQFIYDEQQRLCVQTDSESGQSVFDYDAAGNLAWSAQGQSGWSACPTETADLASARINRAYDARNRLTTIDYPAGTADS
ncbi:MAG TPA: hypothetical protein VFN09_02515, partial [Rhodanobacteraceae bacterium]|nr:hypothetical protein [Rhodanobacteraceae bacterium]